MTRIHSLPSRGRVGVGASPHTALRSAIPERPQRPQRPHPGLPPEGEGARQ